MVRQWLLFLLLAQCLLGLEPVHCLARYGPDRKTNKALRVEHAKKKQPYRALHHTPRQKDPLAVERDLEQKYVLGSDESGTGALAGPIVTATCCIMGGWKDGDSKHDKDPDWLIAGVRDCKRLSKSERRRIYQEILDRPDRYKWTYAVRSAQQIDEAPSVSHAIDDCFRDSVDKFVTQHLVPSDPFLDVENNVFSIVDGKSSPKEMPVPSRPWVGGDNTVYSVALASILAQATREKLMKEASEKYPNWLFDQHQGYGVPQHLATLEQYGPSPIHRRSCKGLWRYTSTPVKEPEEEPVVEVQDDNNDKENDEENKNDQGGMDRASFLGALIGGVGSSILVASPPSAEAMYSDSKAGVRLPERGEIENALPTTWMDSDNPLSNGKTGLSRLDSTSDAIFYKDPRFVEHVDDQAVQSMTSYIGETIASTSGKNGQKPLSVLDVCSSWTSHIPSSLDTKVLQRVAGLGMNAEELKKNPSLTEWTVQDLNESPRLPYQDNSFDLAFCQLSIDYLTKPLEVCQELGRVLKPGGSAHIMFSNRLFLSKAVALWTGADDIDHAYTVGSYFHFCQPSLFSNIAAKDLSVRNKSGRIIGDPLYAVTAIKA